MMRHIFIVVGLFACSGESAPDEVAPPSGPEDPTDRPTYHRDIAPIYAKHCVGCHSAGGIGPFPLDTYEAAESAAVASLSAIRRRTMPPWNMDNSGECNRYRDARWMSDEEIRTVAAWVESDRYEGQTKTTTPRQASASLTDPVPIDPGESYRPIEGSTDDFRCFVVDPHITEDRFLTGFEVIPGRPAIVHHLILFSLPTAQAEQAAIALDERDPGPGYTCYGSAGVPAAGVLAGWAPGSRITRYPEGTGIRLPAGRKLVMQIHYWVAGGVEEDRTRMNLELASSVPEEAFLGGVADPTFVLPPGEEEVVWGRTFPVESALAFQSRAPLSQLGIDEVKLYGVFPHMHTLGTQQRLALEEDACVADVPAWDFNWQQLFFFEEPMTLAPWANVNLTCVYDTRGREEATYFGNNTEDEMCLMGMYLTVPGKTLEDLAPVDEPVELIAPEHLTFKFLEQMRFLRFGAEENFARLLNEATGGTDPSNMLVSMTGITADSTFPFTTDLIGSRGVLSPTGEWALDKNQTETILSGATVDAEGVMTSAPVDMMVRFPPLSFPMRDTTFSGVLFEDGALMGIRDHQIEGCMTVADLAATLEQAGAGSTGLEELAVPDCDTTGDGAFDAYRIIIESQPVTVYSGR